MAFGGNNVLDSPAFFEESIYESSAGLFLGLAKAERHFRSSGGHQENA